MVNIHVVGEPRSGKGLLMTYLALQQADQGTPIDSNYTLKSPNARTISFYDLIKFLKLPRQEPQHLLVLDELPGWCDSYVTSSKSSRYATHFNNQAQKLGYDMIFSSQRSKRSDINFRENTTFRLKANMKKACNLPKCMGGECENFAMCHVRYDFLDIENDDEDVIIGKPLKLPFMELSKIWNRYDTWEAVEPIGLDEVLIEMQKFQPELMNATVNNQVKILLECWQPSYTLDSRTVKDLLLEQGQSWAFADVVFSRLRRRLREPKQPQITQNSQQMTTQNPADNKQLWRKLHTTTY